DLGAICIINGGVADPLPVDRAGDPPEIVAALDIDLTGTAIEPRRLVFLPVRTDGPVPALFGQCDPHPVEAHFGTLLDCAFLADDIGTHRIAPWRNLTLDGRRPAPLGVRSHIAE